jgi:hypothetical protein
MVLDVEETGPCASGRGTETDFRRTTTYRVFGRQDHVSRCGHEEARLLGTSGGTARIVGGEAVEALLTETVLARHERADWYPCEGSYEGCPRRIVPNNGDTKHPLIAMCGHAFPMCHDIALRAEELEAYTASQETFLRVLQRLLDVTGDLVFLDDSYPDCVCVGELSRSGGVYDVFVCGAAWIRRSRRCSPTDSLRRDGRSSWFRRRVACPSSSFIATRRAAMWCWRRSTTFSALASADSSCCRRSPTWWKEGVQQPRVV